jgi:hypothetical protein
MVFLQMVAFPEILEGGKECRLDVQWCLVGDSRNKSSHWKLNKSYARVKKEKNVDEGRKFVIER